MNATGLDSAQKIAPGHGMQPRWRGVAIALAAAVLLQAVFAGAILSGDAWAPRAHAVAAMALVGASVMAALVAALTLRRVAHGPRLARVLAMLALVIAAQTMIGRSAAGGANLMWLHVPLGVALVGLAAHAIAAARRLGG